MSTVLVCGSSAGTASTVRGDGSGEGSGRANEVTIVAEHDHETDDHIFELDARRLSAGWTTLRLENRTEHTHFAFLTRLPPAAMSAADEAGTDPLEYYVEHVTRPFQWFMDDLDPEREPDPDDLSDEYTDLEEEIIFPPWFENIVPSGGVGFTSGDATSTATVDLRPGEYVVECYVKDGDGRFHAYLGMLDLLSVTGDRAGTAPEPTIELTLSTAGLEVPEQVAPGHQTVAVRVEDQRVYEHLLGHDVHLIRLDESTRLADVEAWMNWMDPNGLVSDGSEPGTFLGGVQTILTPDLLEGGATETAYFEVSLNPGAYAWVSEVPAPREKGMLQPFIVPFE